MIVSERPPVYVSLSKNYQDSTTKNQRSASQRLDICGAFAEASGGYATACKLLLANPSFTEAGRQLGLITECRFLQDAAGCCAVKGPDLTQTSCYFHFWIRLGNSCITLLPACFSK